MCRFLLRVITFLASLPFLGTLIPLYVLLVGLQVLLIRLPVRCLSLQNVTYTNEQGELIRSIPHVAAPRDMIKEPILRILETKLCHYYLSFVFNHKVATALVLIRRRFDNGHHGDVIDNKSTVSVFGGNDMDQFHRFINSIHSQAAVTDKDIEITFTPKDSVSAAISEFECVSDSDSGTICILDLASRRHVGGAGYSPFGGSQEEDLIRCSNLYWMLHPKWNEHLRHQLEERVITDSHIPYFGTTYVPNVIFLNEEKNKEKEYRFGVIASAAPDVRTHTNEYKSFFRDATEEQRKTVIVRKLEAVMATCIATNVKVLIAGAFGCGVYKCESLMVAQCFKEVLESPRVRGGQLRKVVFAIAYDDAKLSIFQKCIQR